MSEENISMPRINEPPPAFEARTTNGVKTLADYKGKWLLLFFIQEILPQFVLPSSWSSHNITKNFSVTRQQRLRTPRDSTPMISIFIACVFVIFTD